MWTIALIGGAISVAVIAAALAPSPGNHYQPVGGVLGFAGLGFCIWLAWHAQHIGRSPDAVSDAKARMRARERALGIVEKDPRLATELGIGRPDLPRQFDDGGLVDVNAVPEAVLRALPAVDSALANQIVRIRNDVGIFDSANDLEVLLNLPPTALDQARPFMIFRRP